MDIQMAGKTSFFVYLSGSELERLHVEPSSVGDEETALIFSAAMRQLGKDDPVNASFEVYPGRNDLLMFVSICPGDFVFFRFEDFELLLEAVRQCPQDIPSSLLYYDDTYILSVRSPEAMLLSCLSELGSRVFVRNGFLSHAGEHGRILIENNAVGRLSSSFQLK